MTTTITLTYDSEITIRLAIADRRQELLKSWFVGFTHADTSSCIFWANRIMQLNDAAIEFGMGYDLL
jgi:hypothetical protein